MRQMEHSEEWVEAVSPSFLAAVFPRFRSLLCVVTLSRASADEPVDCSWQCLLKIIEALLPGTIALHSNFHTSKDHFLPTSEVNAQLHDISIIHRPRPRLNAGLTESNMVQKCARGALHVFDIPLAVCTPKLAVSPADHFGFEAHRRRRRHVRRGVRIAIAFRVSSHADHAVFVRQCP